MKARLTAAIVCLLYLCVANFVGVQHHHEAGALVPHKDCAACVWQVNGVSDAQVAFTPFIDCTTETTLPDCSVVFDSSFFCPSSASRAPPAASA